MISTTHKDTTRLQSMQHDTTRDPRHTTQNDRTRCNTKRN